MRLTDLLEASYPHDEIGTVVKVQGDGDVQVQYGESKHEKIVAWPVSDDIKVGDKVHITWMPKSKGYAVTKER